VAFNNATFFNNVTTTFQEDFIQQNQKSRTNQPTNSLHLKNSKRSLARAAFFPFHRLLASVI
jgi:hypothetical protein